MSNKTRFIPQAELDAQLAICDRIHAFWHGQNITPLAYVETYGCQQNEADSERIRGDPLKKPPRVFPERCCKSLNSNDVSGSDA